MAITVKKGSKGQAQHYASTTDLENVAGSDADLLTSAVGSLGSVPGTSIDETSAGWNTTKNVLVDDNGMDVAGSVNATLNEYVHVDVDLADQTGDVDLDINNSKRGNIKTGSGNDNVNLSLVTNNNGWSNQFFMETGAWAAPAPAGAFCGNPPLRQDD